MVSSSLVGVFNYPSFPKTSYESEFTLPEREPTVRFHNYVSFVVNSSDKLIPRCFPHFALRVSPHRILKFERSALGFGPTGAEYENADQRQLTPANAEHAEADEKENEAAEGNSGNNLHTKRSESRLEESEEAACWKQEEEKERAGSFENEDENQQSSANMAPKNQLDIPQPTLDEVTANLYQSTTLRATEECALSVPVRPQVFPSTIGNNEDRALYHSVYPRTGTWKSNVVPEHWERARERPLYENPKAEQYRPYRSNFSKPEIRLLCKREQKPGDVTATKVMATESLPSTVQHIRPSPGYAGLVPKLPVIPSPPRDPRLMLSSSAATYRNVSKEGFRVQEYAHKGPLSKLVTTTTPCNPFNKTTQTSQLTSGLFVI